LWYTNHSLWRAVESTMSTLSSPPNRQESGRLGAFAEPGTGSLHGHEDTTHRSPGGSLPARHARRGGHHITAIERGHGPRAATHAPRRRRRQPTAVFGSDVSNPARTHTTRSFPARPPCSCGCACAGCRFIRALVRSCRRVGRPAAARVIVWR
jgi:hypothetical protein